MRQLAVACAIALASLTSFAMAEAKPLKLDKTHSRVGFTASTVLFDVPGQFKEFSVEVDGSIDDPEHAQVLVRAKVGSIDTDNAKRDEHLRSPDFFDAAKYPELVFKSERVLKKGAGLELSGNLEIHGKKKAITLPLAVVKGKNGAGNDSTAYRGKLNLSRKDFGIGADSVAAKISLDDAVQVDVLIVVLTGPTPPS